MAAGNISENSRRVAKNTLLLYFRMLLLMLIGLFTSRVILKTLGFDDYGIYNAVGGVVTLFSVITTSIAAAISRYMAFELEKGDPDKLRRVFSTSIIVQLGACLLLLVFVETVCMWFLGSHMEIPVHRLPAARWVLQFSMLLMMVQLLSVPFNAAIIAHEKMGAFAYISILEGALKLAVAGVLYFAPWDKLITYAILMSAVALIVRMTYASYCKRHFAETSGKLVFDRSLIREMSAFAGWNALGSGTYAINTHGINVLTNVFFGVVVNAARGVASQVENIVKQFVNSFMTAITPQITKSWAAGNRDYCYELVCKGSKFTSLLILLFIVPFCMETETILQLWLGKYPPLAPEFVRLILFATLVDMVGMAPAQLELATGRIRTYYLITGGTSLLIFALSWLLFATGFEARWAYILFVLVYVLIDIEKLLILRRQVGFPVGRYLREVVLTLALVSAFAVAFAWPAWHFMEISWYRALVTAVCSTAGLALGCWIFGLSEGERAFVKEKLTRK